MQSAFNLFNALPIFVSCFEPERLIFFKEAVSSISIIFFKERRGKFPFISAILTWHIVTLSIAGIRH